MNPFEMKCESCPAYVKIPSVPAMGECRRYPPTALVVQSAVLTKAGSTSHVQSAFPPVPSSGFCWEFPQVVATGEMMKRAAAQLGTGINQENIAIN